MGKYSQGGQEQWLLDYFGDRVGTAIDVGANDGTFFSNTLLLEERGWRVLCIEPNSRCWTPLQLVRKECVPYAISDYNGMGTLKVMSSANDSADWVRGINPAGTALEPIEDRPVLFANKVQVRTLDSVIEETGIGCPDLLTVDVEGGETKVFCGMTCLPEVIVVELNDINCLASVLAPNYDIRISMLRDGIFVRKQ